MISTSDIYFRIDSNLVCQNFWQNDIEEKKRLIDSELKKYIISKIQELNVELLENEINNLSVIELLHILALNIPLDQPHTILNHFIHYIIQVAGNLQNWTICWWVENDEKLITEPLIEFDKNGLWDNLKTHEQTDYIKIFGLVYGTLNNYFLKDDIQKKLEMRYFLK